MADIVRAIEKEKEYLANRIKNEEPFHLVDAVFECGYETLEDYFKAKMEYEFRRQISGVIELTQPQVLSEVERVLTNKVSGVWFADHDNTCVFNGDTGAESFDVEYCDKCGIPVYSLGAGGGTIVHQEGDFSFGVSCLKEIGITSEYFLEGSRDILQRYTEKPVIIDGNDILVDGEKVCGSTEYNQNDMFLMLAYFSFNDKTELIGNICNKDTVKIPGYIDFISRSEFKQEVAEWLQVHSY